MSSISSLDMVLANVTLLGGGSGAAKPPPNPHHWGGAEGPSAPPHLPNCQAVGYKVKPCLRQGFAALKASPGSVTFARTVVLTAKTPRSPRHKYLGELGVMVVQTYERCAAATRGRRPESPRR